jgi:rubrerythrin
MDDLISRAYVLAEYDRQHQGPPGLARKIMEDAPAVDAAPVVHGKWIISPGCLWSIGDCSVCGEQHIGTNAAKYCPNCGAKMDGERRDGE